MAAPKPKSFPVLETSGLAVGTPKKGESRYSICLEGGGDRVAAIDQVDGHKAEELAALFAASPDMYRALWWITRAAKMNGPHGTTAYFISDAVMANARDAIACVEGRPHG